MQWLPNLITVLRLLLSPLLLLFPSGGAAYAAVYALCGAGDMLDGRIARRLGAVSRVGGILDSVSDFVFVLCTLLSVIHRIRFTWSLLIFLSAIFAVKCLNLILGLILYRRCIMPHTILLKCTGIMLFLLPYVLFYEAERYPAILCILAFVASCYSTACILTGDIHEE